jgi:mRNA interferase MazF
MNIDLTKTQNYLEWLKDKLYLNAIAPAAQKRTVFRGQVYRCKLGTGIGSEECKERPCVILQYNSANKSSPNTIVAPITHTSATVPVVVPISDKLDSAGNTILDGNVLLGNIVCVSKARLGNYITDLTNDEMNKIDAAIALSLGIKHHYDTLQNMYNDKLDYIEKLKLQRETLQKDGQALEDLLNEYGINGLPELAEYLKKCKIIIDKSL